MVLEVKTALNSNAEAFKRFVTFNAGIPVAILTTFVPIETAALPQEISPRTAWAIVRLVPIPAAITDATPKDVTIVINHRGLKFVESKICVP